MRAAARAASRKRRRRAGQPDEIPIRVVAWLDEGERPGLSMVSERRRRVDYRGGCTRQQRGPAVRSVSKLARLRALEYQHRRPEPEQALWLGWPGWWVGPGGEQRAEPPAGRVIVLSWGDEQPGGQQFAGGSQG